jgi:hypothetical protein
VHCAAAGAFIEEESEKPALKDPWGSVSGVIGWEARNVAGRTGDRANHSAACHSCLLVAETSCEARNLFLDRALLVRTMSGADTAFLA